MQKCEAQVRSNGEKHGLGKEERETFFILVFYVRMLQNFRAKQLLFCFDNRLSRATMTRLPFSLNGNSSITFVTGSSCGVIRKFVFNEIFREVEESCLEV